MTIDFYYVPGSAPCRAVQLAAAQLGVPLNLKHTDLMKGEHLTPEFLKVNIQLISDNLVEVVEAAASMSLGGTCGSPRHVDPTIASWGRC